MSTTPSTSANTTNNGVNSFQYTPNTNFRMQHLQIPIIVNNTNTFNPNILTSNNGFDILGKLDQAQLANKTIKSELNESSYKSVTSPPSSSKAKQLDGNANQRLTVHVDDHRIDVCVNNVVCSYSTKCHLNLRKIATSGMNVEYKKENGVCIQ
jgi:hypothetical protein